MCGEEKGMEEVVGVADKRKPEAGNGSRLKWWEQLMYEARSDRQLTAELVRA